MRYSYSNLKTFLTCPRQWEAKYVTKVWPKEHDTPALIEGRKAHDLMERAVNGEIEVPPSLWVPEGLVATLRAAGAAAEYKIELDRPAFVGYLDVLVTTPGHALVIDWKTGKLRPDPMQADVYAFLLREKTGLPDLSVEFWWVGVKARAVRTCNPDKHASHRVLDVIDTIEKTAGNYPPVESWACRFCPLTWCENNRSK